MKFQTFKIWLTVHGAGSCSISCVRVRPSNGTFPEDMSCRIYKRLSPNIDQLFLLLHRILSLKKSEAHNADIDVLCLCLCFAFIDLNGTSSGCKSL